MSLPPESSSSILGSGSLGSESPPQEILQRSSFVPITETPSMISLPSRQNAGEDASAMSNAADYNENNGSGSHKSQGQSSSKNKNGRIPTFFYILSLSSQICFIVSSLSNSITGWTSFEETLKYGYGISIFLQFELFIVFLLCSCIGDGCASFFACFNVAVVTIIENIMALYVLSTDWNVQKCDSDGCAFLQGPYHKRKEFLQIHGILGLTHFIMTVVFCCVRSTSRQSVTSSNTCPSRSSMNHNTSQASQKRATRSQPSSIKPSRASHSQSSRASSYRSTTIKYNVRVKPSSTSKKSKHRRNETTLNIPQKHGYPISSSYPQTQHSSTVCHPSLPPPIPCGYRHSFIQQQHFPLQNITNNFADGGRTVVIDVPETEQPYGFIDIQRVVIKLPPLNPSEAVSVPPEYRDSSKQGNETHKRVFCTKVTEFK